MSKAMWDKYEKMRDEAIAAAHARGVREGLERAAKFCDQAATQWAGNAKFAARELASEIRRLPAEQGSGVVVP